MNDAFMEIDSAIRAGQLGAAKEKIRHLLGEKMSRSEALHLAELCRRADLPTSALKLLKPYIHKIFPDEEPASQVEVAEYAISLTRVGASRQALVLLDKLPESNDPRIDFSWAAALFARWRYDQAIPYLERYIESPKIGSYERLIGQINLLAARLFVKDLDRAAQLVEAIRPEFENGQNQLLFANLLRLSAQFEIQRANYGKAEKLLKQSLGLLAEPHGLYLLFAQKWMAIIDLVKAGPTKGNLARLVEVREAALLCRHWETIRDCDFYRARATQDEQLLLQLYFGTPYERYRDKIIAELPKGYEIPKSYSWAPLGKSKKSLDLIMAEADGGRVSFKPDHSIFLLLHALFVDFYAASNFGTLFGELFPEDVFDPDHSPNRIFHLLRRLRTFLKSKRIPIEILQEQGDCTPVFTAPIEVLVPPRFDPELAKEIYLRRLSGKWKSEFFSTQECASFLAVSRPTASRILKWGIERDWVEKTGETSYARYRLKIPF